MIKQLAVSAVVLAALAPASLTAQDDDAAAAVVHQLFDAMRAKDTATVRHVFHPEARLQSVGPDRDGRMAVRTTSIDAFVGAIGGATAHLDERIWDTEVQSNGGLATVWTRYAFYADGTFSHCGVDAFQLANTGDGWKILQVADTRQRDGCDIPGGN
jgi:ketosteroid isomerase-like protein